MSHPKNDPAAEGLPAFAPPAGGVPRPGRGSGAKGSPRLLVTTMTLAVVAYSLLVLAVVALAGDIGLRCIFGTTLKAPVLGDYRWTPERPRIDPGLRKDRAVELLQVGDVVIKPGDYTDFIKAQRRISYREGDWIASSRIGEPVAVRWRDPDGAEHTARATIRRRPRGMYIWSVIWFLQEMVIFAVGARVFWKRPHDDSARLFFWLCVVTVGAFMGGYHWSVILIWRPLIFLFAPLAMLVPIISLHFYLVFPRANPIFVRHRRRVLAVLYGVPAAYLGALWLGMAWSTLVRGQADKVYVALGVVKGLALGYVALAVVVFGLCIACLIYSFRAAHGRAERNQVQWILLASLLSSLLIAVLLWRAVDDPAILGLERWAWPMYGVSLLYTLAYAISITRYKLMQAEAIVSRSVTYVLVSVAAGLVWSGMLVVGALAVGYFTVGYSRAEHPWSRDAWVVGGTAIVILILSDVARHRFQRAIDRRFYREKSKFDQAMRQMSQAVSSLVDRPTLGRRLLEAAAEVLRLDWGALYLVEEAGGRLRLAACHGPVPDEEALAPDNPLVARLHQAPTVRLPRGTALAGSDPATDAMIALGGEIAAALEADGVVAGLLVLGPKRSGLPYEDEDVAFLGALGSVATLALRSAGIQQTLESLNHELRDKVEKIAEQRRRILILQDQLLDHQLTDRGEAPADGRPAAPAAEPEAFGRIKGSGPAVRALLEVARKVAASPSAVLVRGESGTGKELLAEAIHAASPRAAGPFVKVHCAALSQGLLESELFGHVKGAFTGADRDRVGRFQQADGGTLFLDEIGDINLEVQTKLLRVLQEMAFERVGSSQPVTVDVRIVAATHQDLEALIRAGRFREDLYYRLNVISLRTPALRERKEDIFELAVHFLGHHARRAGKAVTHLDDEAIEALVAHDWPGNIRELENVVERAVVLADGPALTRDDLPPEVRRPSRRRPRLPAPAGVDAIAAARPRPALPAPAGAAEPDGDLDDEEAEAFERRRLLDALEEARGNKSVAARYLAMPRSTFFSKLKKHGLA
jgi:DNA-binding NtrC family response regulator